MTKFETIKFTKPQTKANTKPVGPVSLGNRGFLHNLARTALVATHDAVLCEPRDQLAAMCNHLAILHAAPNIVRACRASGVTLPPSTPPPLEYAAGKTCKHAKDKDGKLGGTTFPVLHLSGGELTIETMEWGVRQLSTHNIWCDDDKWVETKTWRACIASGRRCAVCVNAFAEGITCRQPSDGLFFLAALHLNGAFIILTTDSTRVPLLAERAASQAEHGVPTRCPLWMDAAEATRCSSRTRSPKRARSLAPNLDPQLLTRCPSHQATHWLTDEAAATPAGAIAAVPPPPGPWTVVACTLHTHTHTHHAPRTTHTPHGMGPTRSTHCRCAVSRLRCALISRSSCRGAAPPLAPGARPSSPTRSKAPSRAFSARARARPRPRPRPCPRLSRQPSSKLLQSGPRHAPAPRVRWRRRTPRRPSARPVAASSTRPPLLTPLRNDAGRRHLTRRIASRASLQRSRLPPVFESGGG